MSEYIDIRRPGDVTLTCPTCGHHVNLPTNWRDYFRADNPDWDGQLRCNKHKPMTVMEEQ